MDASKVNKAVLIHQKPDVMFTYGTAGFRTKANVLDSVMFRMGLLAALRSKSKSGQTIGVMVTASHNPVEDNGIKLVDPMGEMLEQSWEGHATDLARASDGDVASTLSSIAEANNIDLNSSACVVIARDTRPSSLGLSQAAIEGVKALDGNAQDFGVMTTPQLHYIVCCINTKGDYGQPTEDGYYQKFSQAFIKLNKLIGGEGVGELTVDGANGVGALKARSLCKHLEGVLKINVLNDGSDGVLNKDCGADFVKSNQKAPVGLEMDVNNRYCSFDGDADRIVYYYLNSDKEFRLLDGDKIATLIAGFIQDKLNVIGITLTKGLGVVQTAYANGSSTEYLNKKLNVPVGIAKTGVKHLHRKALEFDIGVYFEANGHGTVIYSKEATQKVKNPSIENLSDTQKEAAEKLRAFMELTNQAVGDAISDMLLVEAILKEKQWRCSDWDKEYTDLPNKLSKVAVKDRKVLETSEDERRLVKPIELQNKIDELVKNWSRVRAFVRPSGTEDVVRIYAEAETQAITDNVCGRVGELVYDQCQGMGTRPHVPPLV